MKKIQDKQRGGIIYKGGFCPFWGGVMYGKSKEFFRGGLNNISATILANQHENGVVEIYEEYGIQDDKRKDIQDCWKQPKEPI